MMKPVMNLDEVEFDDVEENGIYTSSRATISDHIGAKNLGYNLTILPPGKVQCPFHSHHGEEEMFLILEGEGELRFGEQRFPLRRHDVIAMPAGRPGGGAPDHQHRHDDDALSLAVDAVEIEACEYPDSGKVLVAAGKRGNRVLRKMFRAENTVDYYDREER
ncbi:MAG: cupin domain-containing protein [Aliidongia sp.]